MNRTTYRSIKASLYDRLPAYLPNANTLTREEAQVICALTGDSIDDVARELVDANAFASSPRTRADINGNGLGQYNNARRLFVGYILDLWHEAICDDAQTARNEG